MCILRAQWFTGRNSGFVVFDPHSEHRALEQDTIFTVFLSGKKSKEDVTGLEKKEM